MTFYRQNCLNLKESASIFYPMAEKMPEALRKHFESKEKGGEQGEKSEEHSKMKRKEALRKAQKAKMKRKAEEKGAEAWFSALKIAE